MGRFFVDFFPPPKYLMMPSLGLDISDRSIKYVEFEKKGNTLSVKRFNNIAVPQGFIESGEIKEKEAFIDFLKSLQKDFGYKYFIASLPEEKAYVANLRLPQMDKNSIRGSLEVQLEEYIPLSVEEAIFDYEIIGTNANNELEVNLIVFPKTLVEDYKNVFTGANMIPTAFELEVQASVRAAIPKNDSKTQMLIDFGKTRTTFTIIRSGMIEFTSTTKISGEEIEKSIMQNMKVDPINAEKIKKEYGFMKTKKENDDVFKLILPAISSVKDEIIRNLSFWDSHSKGDPSQGISRILFCGGDSNLRGLPEYLSSELKIPVEYANPWINVSSFSEYIPDIEFKDSLSYVTAIGLGLRAAGFN